MSRLAKLLEAREKTLTISLRSISIVTLQLLLFAALAHAQAGSPAAQRPPLGSLMTVGEVYVNDSRAPSELTIFSGDSLRTAESGTAELTTETKGSYQVSPNSQVEFSGDARYLAELKSGSISVKSSAGPGRAIVRVGDFVVVPTILNSQTVEKIDRMADGSFLITCSVGNLGIVTMEGAQGRFLEAGQSARISAKNELVAMDQPNQPPTQGQGSAQPVARNYRPWIYLGLAGGGAAAIAVWATSSGSGHQSVSPSSP